MANKPLSWMAVLLVLLAVGAGGWYVTHPTNPGAGGAANLPPDRIGPEEHVLGNANAPVTMIEYFAQACSVCAHFDQEVFPLLKAKYIDTGKVRYVMRLFPLFPFADPPAYKLDMCLPKDQFFHATDTLFRHQPEWDDAEYPVGDRHAGLIKVARILGLSSEQADACMTSTRLDEAINRTTLDAKARYNPGGTPFFVIDFQPTDLSAADWTQMQAALDAALAAKGVK